MLYDVSKCEIRQQLIDEDCILWLLVSEAYLISHRTANLKLAILTFSCYSQFVKTPIIYINYSDLILINQMMHSAWRSVAQKKSSSSIKF